MELLHFDTESRKVIVKLTCTELLHLVAQLIHSGPFRAVKIATSSAGEVELLVERD